MRIEVQDAKHGMPRVSSFDRVHIRDGIANWRKLCAGPYQNLRSAEWIEAQELLIEGHTEAGVRGRGSTEYTGVVGEDGTRHKAFGQEMNFAIGNHGAMNIKQEKKSALTSRCLQDNE
jgi:hypothetical protein